MSLQANSICNESFRVDCKTMSYLDCSHMVDGVPREWSYFTVVELDVYGFVRQFVSRINQGWVSEQLLNGTSAQYRLYSARQIKSWKEIEYVSEFVQTLKHCFPELSRTCKKQIPGFSRTQKMRFQELSRIHSVHKHGCMRLKRAHTKAVFDVAAL